MQDSHRVLPRISLAWGALSALGLLLSYIPAHAATLAAEAAADFDIEQYVNGLADPTDVTILPDGRAVIIQKLGNIAVKTPGVEDPVEAHIDVDTNHNERGLLGVVADPAFATNSFIYFYASSPTAPAENRHQVLRYKLSAAGALSDMTPVVTMGLRGPANHNGGGIDIYQGNLYIGVGDTGANSVTPSNHFGSCLNIANGKVLRVSLAEGMLGQAPADNPLFNETTVTGCTSTSGGQNGAFSMEMAEKRIYAWGFRNPFRLWVDQQTGKVWVGDVGEETREEVSVVEKGKHYGYPFEEGTTKYDQGFKPVNGCAGIKLGDKDGPACSPPVYDWERDPGGTAIGGRILDGCGWSDKWKKRYIFGDHEQGKTWTLDVNATRDGMVAGSVKDFATTSGITAMRMGTDNALYLVERGAGRVSRVTFKGGTATPGSCPTVNSDGGGNPQGGSGAGGNAGAGGGGNPGGNASGGSGNPAGGSPSAGGGPGPGTAGTKSSTAGTNGANGESGDSGGCGCRTAGGVTGSALGLSALVGALGLALQRRRRSRRS